MERADVVLALQQLQRQRSIVIKSKNMQASRIQAIVAGTLGYHTGLKEKERAAKFKEATAVIQGVLAGTQDHALKTVIRASMAGVEALEAELAVLDKELTKQAKLLPVAGWVLSPEQKGFGLPSLGTVIGETGDLSNYANPAKVWRRMGCAPFEYGGKVRMGSTWKGQTERKEKLPAAQWTEYGYCPRRRAIMFVIGENLLKQNYGRGLGTGEGKVDTETPCAGPYRARYDEAKARCQASHPEYTPLRCHRHAMLCASKRLLRELWIEWQRTAGATTILQPILSVPTRRAAARRTP